MYGYSIHGNHPLYGEIPISGSKNACLPIMAATLLTKDPCLIENVPDIRDIQTMIQLLQTLGKSIIFENGTLTIEEDAEHRPTLPIRAPYEIVKTMRASISVLGPLLARYHDVEVSLPGGCSFGPRPVDLHLKGMEYLGASIEIKEGYIHAYADQLLGKDMVLRGEFGPTVLGTDNVMSAAALAQGTTVIRSAAQEPEVEDLCRFLINMGAQIEGVGSDTLTIHGVDRLHGAHHRVIPDRLETGTFAALIALTKGEAKITHCDPSLLEAPLTVFRQMGIHIEWTNTTEIHVGYRHRFIPQSIQALPYPAFPTDLQPVITVLNALADGQSTVTDSIYPERFIYSSELNRMGTDIHKISNGISIQGVHQLNGTKVIAPDIRAGAALAIACLAAQGESQLSRIYHIERGYENFVEKIKALGGNIEKVTLDKHQW